MEKINLVFGRESENPFHLCFTVRETPIALRWLKILKQKNQTGKLFSGPARFRGFATLKEDWEHAESALKKACAVLETYSPGTLPQEWRAPIETAAQLDHLHCVFEKMRGSFEFPNPAFFSAPLELQAALNELNERVHELEILRCRRPNSLSASIKTLFADDYRETLSREDYAYFEKFLPSGAMYLHYAQVGTTWLDVFEEPEKSHANESIRPLAYVSGEFDIRFGSDTPKDMEKKLAGLADWLRGRGQDPADPALRIGWIIVADLDRGQNSEQSLGDAEIVRRIALAKTLDEVNFLEGRGVPVSG